MKKNKDLIIGLVVGIFMMSIITIFIINKMNSTNKSYSKIEDKNKNNIETKISDDNKEESENTKDIKDENIINDEEYEKVTEKSNTNEQKKITDESIINFFEKQKQYTKDAFITIADFIFYDKEIYGTTFNELNEEAKLRIINIAIKIDYEIEKKHPNYKEEIDKKYKDCIEKALTKYIQMTDKICVKLGDELCNQAKKDYEIMKDTFKLTLNKIKEYSSEATESIKNWYEEYSLKN